jgi:sn-glycerol 3-phosphate transport system substrate-binding protein
VAQIGAAPLLGSTGAIVPIGEFLEGPDGIDKTLIPAVFWDYNTAGGKLWSMPFNHSVPVLYYNRDLFSAAGLENPPETWDELVQTAQKLTLDTDQNGQIDQWGLNVADDTHWYLSTMFLENGAQIVNPAETEVLYNSPEAVEMLTMWGDFVHTHRIMPANQHSEAKGDFLAGKLGMLLSSSSGIPSMEEDASFKVGVAMLPAVAGRERALPVGGASLVIFKDPNLEIQKAAWAFVKFMTSKDSSLYLTTHTGYLPIYAAAADWPELVPYLQEHPNQVVPLESLKYATAIPEFSALGTSDSELRKAVETVELKAATPQEALDQAKKAVDKAITEQGDAP